MDRRDFVKATTATVAAGTLVGPRALLAREVQADASVRDLCRRALDAAKRAGASYADVRVVRNRSQSVSSWRMACCDLVSSAISPPSPLV